MRHSRDSSLNYALRELASTASTIHNHRVGSNDYSYLTHWLRVQSLCVMFP
jgi:hypothetical protein